MKLTTSRYDNLSQVVSIKREIKRKRYPLWKRKNVRHVWVLNQTVMYVCVCVCVCLCSSHCCLSVLVGQYAVDLDLALVQVVQIDPHVLSPSVCWTKTLPSVVLLGVLLRETGRSLEVKFS